MKFTHLKTEQEILSLIDFHNENSEYVVMDFETTDKNPRKAKLVDIQMSGYDKDEAVIFDGACLPLLKRLRCTQVGQNWIGYDWYVAERHGVSLLKAPVRDTMLLDHLANENRPHDLDSWVQEIIGDPYKELFWNKYDNYLDAPFEERMEYACKDIIYTRAKYVSLLAELEEQKIPESLIQQVHDLAIYLLKTEVRGVAVDLDYTIKIGTELKTSITGLKKDLRQLGGIHCESIEMSLWLKEMEKRKTLKGKRNVEKPEFNFESSKQVCELLYTELKLPVQINKKTKSRTADDKALERLGDKHPVLPKIRELRKASKMYGTFVEGILDKVEDERIYPSFNVNGTVTGRISHSSPNLGQIPSKGEWVKLRGIFIPDSSYKIITCDYGQLEVCIEAHYSQDKNLLKIIHEGASKHDITAQEVGLPRSTAKTLNFAMQYRCGVPKVAEIVGCSLQEAEHVFNKYWEVYSGVQRVFEECCERVKRGLPIVTLFGRKRRFPTQFESKWKFEAACRQAYSSLIQGSGADMTSYSFIKASRAYEDVEKIGYGLFTVHDECLMSPEDKHVSKGQELVSEAMLETPKLVKLSVPLTVDCSSPLDRWQK